MQNETLAVIGTGYVGLVTAACLADLGNQVIGIDRDHDKIARIMRGDMPIYEPGLGELVARAIASGRLRFTTDLSALRSAGLVMLAVGTPSAGVGGAVDLSQVWSAIEDIVPKLAQDAIVIGKSTLPIGTGREIAQRLQQLTGRTIQVASNPEFLREGQAIGDFMQPDRIIIGADSPGVAARIENLYRAQITAGTPVLSTTLESSELIKYAANAFLATKVAFINEISDLAEAVGADIGAISAGIGMDPRIGNRFLQPGPGYGGSCFPKDTLALAYAAREMDQPTQIVEATIRANVARSDKMLQKIIRAIGPVAGKNLAVLGLAFKAGTDDMRDAPALPILRGLLAAGAKLRAYDPKAGAVAAPLLPGLDVVDSAAQALGNADAAIILTEWQEFRDLTPADFVRQLQYPVVVDLRNLYAPATMANGGVHYHSLGRTPCLPPATKAARHG
jgi:UDPglucose 6-dehydrogenase